MKSKKEKLIETAKSDKIEEAKIESNIKGTKKIKYSVLLIVLIILVVFAAIWFINNRNIETDGDKFKVEYEQLNGKFDEERNRKYLEVKLENTEVIKYATYSDVFKLLDNGTGIVYFGFKECPWCRNLIPNLLEAANIAGIDRIYYLNNKEDRDLKILDDNGNIVTKKEGTEDYYKLIELLSDDLGSYAGLNDENIKRLYYPTVLFVKDGKVVDIHIGTVDSHTDSKVSLTDEQKEELVNTLVEKLNKTITCNEAC